MVLAKARARLNSVAKDVGNRLYDGLGDKLSEDISLRPSGLGLVGAVVLGAALIGGCGGGNKQYYHGGIPRVPAEVANHHISENSYSNYNAKSLATDVVKGLASFGLMVLDDGPSRDYSISNGSKIILYTDKNGDGIIQNGGEIFHFENVSGVSRFDISEHDFIIANYMDVSGKYINTIISPDGEKIFEEKISPIKDGFRVGKGDYGHVNIKLNHIYTTNMFRAGGYRDNVRDVSWVANEVIDNPGVYTFVAERGLYKQVSKMDLFCSDPMKLAGRTGLGEVESVNEE